MIPRNEKISSNPGSVVVGASSDAHNQRQNYRRACHDGPNGLGRGARLGLLTLLLSLFLMSSVFGLSISINGNPAKNVNGNSATIQWNTDVDATSRVDFGKSISLGQNVENLTFTRFHSVLIEGLDVNVKYYFQITSIAQSGEYKVADNNGQFYTFTTVPNANTVPPGFANIRATALGDDSTTFQWSTTKPASTLVSFGETKPYQISEDSALVVDHVVTIPTTSGKLYAVFIGGCDSDSNCVNATNSVKFLAGAQTGTPPLTTSIPQYTRDNRLDVAGVTRPFSTVDIFVNTIKQRTVTAEGNGTFRAPNIILTKLSASNDVKLVVTDAAGNTVEQTYTVKVDPTPPNVQLNPIPAVASATPLTISGTVNKHTKITYEVQSAFDTTPPARATGLKTSSVQPNSVALSWTDNAEADLGGYAVYRDGVRIATTAKATFTDTVSSGSSYTYRVSAFDKSCNEGPLSDSIIVQAPNGGTQLTSEPSEVPVACASQKQTLDASGPFSFGAALQDGDNHIRITVTDDAGNKVVFLNTTRLDNQAPRILSDNLDRLSPTYIPQVTVKGKISEKATVFIYVNGDRKHPFFAVTDDDGTFSIDVALQHVISTGNGTVGVPNLPGQAAIESGASRVTGAFVVDAGTGGYPNTLTMEVIDQAGLKTTKGPVNVLYALCGQGSWFKVDIGELSPTVVIPRLIIEGVQQVGFPVNVTYQGAGTAVIQRVTVTPVPLSNAEADNYDTGWARINPIFPRKTYGNSAAGYIQLVFDAQSPATGQTTSQKEDELYKHRAGKECLTPGVGCAKFFLEVDIEAQESIPKKFIDIRNDLTTGNVSVETIRQKNCLPIEVQMDVPLHLSDKIPKHFLEATSQFLTSAMDTIDSLLRPLTTIGTYTLYTCFAMNAWLFVKFIDESWSCDIASHVPSTSFNQAVAQIGACDQAYPPDKESGKNTACTSCSKAVNNRVSFERTLRKVCDRVGCPSVPTLQTYIGDQQKKGVVDTGVVDTAGNKLYAGNSCGFTGKEVVGTNTAITSENEHLPDFTASLKSQPVGFGYDSIKNQYVSYQKHKDDEAPKLGAALPTTTPTAGTSTVNCAGIHAASPECCGYDYYKEWGSACGIPGILETYDELEQSACLAAQSANKIPDFEQAASAAANSPVKCNSLFNSAAGFCDPAGKPVGDTIPTGVFYNSNPTASANSREVYIRIDPVPPEDPKSYKIFRGYVFQRFVEDRLPPGQRINDTSQARTINQKNDFIPDKELTSFFTDTSGPVTDAQVGAFAHALCDDLGSANVGVCNSKAKDVYTKVRNSIGIPDRTYLVRPDLDGILRSVQCVCLPAVTSYLTFWRTVLSNVKGCVDHIRLTGDGSSGICQATLSTYVCDMLYDLLRCFIQKFGNSGAGTREEGAGVGNLLGALSGAGGKMQQSVQGRYGDTALWKTMFQDHALLHSICAFAFTGKWDLNVAGIFQQTVNQIPIESQGLIYPADRRYVAYNPVTTPKGLTTWLYHFGVGLIAGADLDYTLTLKCSSGLQCSESDGFKGGKCDCFGAQEQTLPVIAPGLGNGKLRKNDALNTELFYSVQAGDSGSGVRYDTAILQWQFKDSRGQILTGKAESKIHLTGGDAPNFCSIQLLGTPLYLCKFSVGDISGVSITKDPVITSPAGNVTLLKSPIEFRMNVNLFGSPDPRPQGGVSAGQNTKFLVYEIRNGNGIIVDQNKQIPVKIDTEGDKEYVIRSKTISEAMFGVAGTVDYSNAISLKVPPGTPAGIWDVNNYRKNGQVALSPAPATQIGGLVQGQNINLVVVFNGASADVYESDGLAEVQGNPPKGSDAINPGRWGLYAKLVGSVRTFPIQNGNGLYLTGPIGISGLPPNAIVQLSFLRLPPTGSEMLIHYTPAASNPCANYQNTPDTWSATFTVFDGRKPLYGGLFEPNFDQISVDADGNPAQKSIRFQSVCKDSYAGAGSISTPGFPTNLRICSPDPTVSNENACFCGTAQEALRDAQLGILKHNCGQGNDVHPGQNYCGYTIDNLRSCSTGPVAGLPVLFNISFFEVDTNGNPTNVERRVGTDNTVTLQANRQYGLSAIGYYASPYDLTVTSPSSEPSTFQASIDSGKRQLPLFGSNGLLGTAQTLNVNTGSYTITVADSNDPGKTSIYALRVTAQ